MDRARCTIIFLQKPGRDSILRPVLLANSRSFGYSYRASAPRFGAQRGNSIVSTGKKILCIVLGLGLAAGLMMLFFTARTADAGTPPSVIASPTPSVSPAVQTADADTSPAPSPTSEAIPIDEDSDINAPVTVLDPDTLTQIVEDYLREHDLSGNGITISYCYTGTGEIWLYNGDNFSEGASFYKLPLSMLLNSALARGELTPESKVCGMNVMYALERMLVYSDNTVAEYLLSMYDYAELRALGAQLAGLSEESCPLAYEKTNSYSPRFMLGLLLELYRNSEDYPDMIDCMLRASPGHFFRLTLEGQYDVAQKYGSRAPALNAAAIVYTPRPFLLTVLTMNVGGAENVLGDLAELFAEYTLTLDDALDLLSDDEQQRAAAQLGTAAVDPSVNPLPIYAAASDEYYAQQTQEYTKAALRESEAAADDPRS